MDIKTNNEVAAEEKVLGLGPVPNQLLARNHYISCLWHALRKMTNMKRLELGKL